MIHVKDIYFAVMQKNATSHPKQQGWYGAVYIQILCARVKSLAIEQERVNQSSIAANKNEPFESVWGPGTVNN